VIAGFERADRGVVRLAGEVRRRQRSLRGARSATYRLRAQDGSPVPAPGGLEQNVGFGLPRRERGGKRVGELLDMVGLGGLERRYPHQLSVASSSA